MELFPVFQVNAEDALHDEELGTKPKFWIEMDGHQWLFKEARANTGEDWSEKLAFEFAMLMGIPAAYVELAEFDGKRGTISRSFLNRDKGESLIHGNEILAGLVLGYDPQKRFGQTDHTLENIQKAVAILFKEDWAKVEQTLECMASYLLLDALIINTDRHHENWGVLSCPVVNSEGRIIGRELSMAPTFDHASSLGRDLLDANIERKFSDHEAVARYVQKGKGAIYLNANSRKGENPLELLNASFHRRPELFRNSLARLQKQPVEAFHQLIEQIPQQRMSRLSCQFVKSFVAYTYAQLCRLEI